MNSPISSRHSRRSSSIPPVGRSARGTRLQDVPSPAFALMIGRLLRRMGYRDVRVLGAGRGRNKHGGIDFRATAGAGLTQTVVVGQVKQYSSPVPRCFVDELRGAMLRLGAQHGLLITTSSFAAATCEAAASGQFALPVRLVDGHELADLLDRPDPGAALSGTACTNGGEPPHVPAQTGERPCVVRHRCAASRLTGMAGAHSPAATVLVLLSGVGAGESTEARIPRPRRQTARW